MRLIGHFNPLRDYPARVVPICCDESGEPYAVYLDDKGVSRTPVPNEVQWEKYRSEASIQMDYDSEETGVFARWINKRCDLMSSLNPFIKSL